VNDVPDVTSGLSVGAARLVIAQAFRRRRLDTPELDARVLVGHALALDHAALTVAAQRPITPQESDAIGTLVGRRLAGEPVARIIGSKEFWGLQLQITPATLVPRPETETIVEAALSGMEGADQRTHPWRVADIGTGSGAILLALLSELPHARGVGTDINLSALRTARQNARRLNFASRASFVACSFAAALGGGFDVIVANPPYIRTDDIASLAPEVRDFDPRAALDGGVDGLSAYRAFVPDLGRLLAAEGRVVVELGVKQDSAVANLVSKSGLKVMATHRDLAGIPRALVARF
jgi:release factor glutamine methyltransferase